MCIPPRGLVTSSPVRRYRCTGWPSRNDGRERGPSALPDAGGQMRSVLVCVILALLMLVACQDPLSRDTTRALRDQLIESQRRKLQAAGPERTVAVPPFESDLYLQKDPERIKKLDAETG